MPLKEYKDVVATAAGITTIAQFFSPIFICMKMVQSGHAKGTDPMPFIGGMVMSVLFLEYGLILKDEAMIPVNLLGFLLNSCYALCYYCYADQKERRMFFSTLTKAIAFVIILLSYTRLWEDKTRVEFRFGMITTVLLLLLIGSPLFDLGEIVRKKNVSNLPFPLIATGTAVSFLWLLYGIIIENIFMKVQNTVALGLSLIQLSLFAIYPSTPPVEDDKKKI